MESNYKKIDDNRPYQSLPNEIPYSHQQSVERFNYINNLPKIAVYSTQHFLRNIKVIAENNDMKDVVIIGIYNSRDENQMPLEYRPSGFNDNITYYSFVHDFKGVDFYKQCEDLNRYIFHNKDKKFIIVSHDGFGIAHSLARFIADFYVTDKERYKYIKDYIDQASDDWELTFWLRRAYFKYPLTVEEMQLIVAANKAELNFKEPSTKSVS